MLVSFAQLFEKWLNIGLGDAPDNDLYHVQVINLSYLMVFLSFIFLIIIFAFMSYWPLVWFNGFMLLFSLLGFRLNAQGQHDKSAQIFPVFTLSYILVNVFVFFGAGSNLHWSTSILAVYGFTAFDYRHKKTQILTLVAAGFVFIICDVVASERGMILTPLEQSWVSYYTFLSILCLAAIIMHLVVGRLRKVNDYLRHLSEIDELTGIANRRKVLADAVNIFADAIMNQESCAFAILDLDHFKKINDTYGHEAGDLVLKEIASEMQNKIASDFRVGRYGGEEFIVIMPQLTADEAVEKMDELRQSIESMQIMTSHGIFIPVTVSIGVSVISLNTGRYEEILAEADKALYEAKAEGRNRTKKFSMY